MPLSFGTSGLRGLVVDITDLEAYVNVKGALRYLLDSGDIRAGSEVVLAGDLRPSTDRIMRACARAILDSGCGVENAGKVPTPALILHAVSNERAGVMVSGSHIPFDRNGIKLSKSGGEILKSDEPGIMREVERVRLEDTGSAFTAAGMLERSADLPPLNRAAEERYVRRYLDSFAPGGLSGLRVLVYEHSAVGRDIGGRILRELGAEVVTAGRVETFVPIDTENVTDELLDLLEGLVRDHAGGRPIDAVVSTDGDSDRPLVAAVLPASGAGEPGGRRLRFLPGDLLGIVVAEYLRADAVAVPVTANDAVERRMTERGVLLRTTKVGSPYVISALDELGRAGTHARIVGWEANGGFLLGSAIELGHGVIGALPTRDSTLPILANLFAATEQRIGLDALWNRLPARFGRSGLVDGVPASVTETIMAHLDAATLARFFTPALGFDDIVRIDTLDGVRAYFANGEVAHIRPSGNAPQLRIYANSDSQARADRIVNLGVREPDGILRMMVQAFS